MRSIPSPIPGRPGPTKSDKNRMTTTQWSGLQVILKNEFGIILNDRKRALVDSHINQRVGSSGIESFAEYLDLLHGQENHQELVRLVDVVATNVTRFFREQSHFRFLEQAATEWVGEGRTSLRFWSAACSTGEEAYSLAMMLHPLHKKSDPGLEILATDISTSALAHCRVGLFCEDRLDAVPAKWKLLKPRPSCLRRLPNCRRWSVYVRI